MDFPPGTQVLVKYPRNRAEEQGDRAAWPWMPGTVEETCGGHDEWLIVVESRDVATTEDGTPAPAGTGRHARRGSVFSDVLQGRRRDQGGGAVSDRFARVLTGLAVLAVATIAAIVSYAHIAGVALSHGYTDATAKLLPFSVDGLILAASLVLLAEARAQRPAPRLARAGLWLGICATLAANVEHGAAFGPVGALVNAWPGAAFVMASEILLGMIRRARTTPSREEALGTVAGDVPGPVPGDVAAGVPVNATAGVPAGAVSPAPDVTAQAVSDDVLPGVTPDTPVTRARMPHDATDTVPPSASAPVPRVAPAAPRRRSPGRAPTRRPKSPEKVFAAELAAGELPSLRQVKERMHVGTPRARGILADLQAITQEQAA